MIRSSAMEAIPKVEVEEETETIDDDSIHEGDKTKEDIENLPDHSVVRLTPTGKISHAKTRVYTQRYRKEWETMSDFKDWLTSVPMQATRAFCKFCQRNLHAHRLSLLKHMCTLKHQRAAVQYSRRQPDYNGEQIDISNDGNYGFEAIDGDEEYDENETTYEENYVQEEEEEEEEEEILENDGQEVVEESDDDSYSPDLKKIKIQDEELTEESYNSVSSKPVMSISDTKNNGKKVFILSSNGKSYTFVKGKIPQLLLNQSTEKNFTFITKPVDDDLHNLGQSRNPAAESVTPTSSGQDHSQELLTKNASIPTFLPSVSRSVLSKKPLVSTHVIETSKGVKVSGLQVSLYKLEKGRWTFVHESVTNANGDCNDLSNTNKSILSTGRYKLHYDVEKYYSIKKTATVYPFIEIVFDIKDPGGSYHIPLLLSPFSYSTYKDTLR